MVDPVRTAHIREKELQADLSRLEMAELLKHGNIAEIRAHLPRGISVRDIDAYMGEQWRLFVSQVLQHEPAYSGAGEPQPIAISDVPPQNTDANLTQGEGRDFFQSMISSLGRGGGVVKGTGEEEPMTPDEIAGAAEGTLNEWQNFVDDMWGSIFDAQMMQDYQKRMGEVQKEVQKIIAMAKSGQVDPEYVLIALAKVNVTRNGCLMTWLGKKAFLTNESMNRIADELRATPAANFSQMQYAQAQTRDGAFQLQLQVMDMQKVMSDVSSVLEQVHGFMGEINRTRREIITKFTATG